MAPPSQSPPPQTAELPGAFVRGRFSYVALRAAEYGATGPECHTQMRHLLRASSGQVAHLSAHYTYTPPGTSLHHLSVCLSIHPALKSTFSQGEFQFYQALGPLGGG